MPSTTERRNTAARASQRVSPLVVVLALLALGLAIGVLVAALAISDHGTSRMMSGAGARPAGMMGSSSQGATMMGFGGHGRFTSPMIGAAAHGTVYVQLGEYWVAPAAPSVRAGKVTFVARNVGRLPHELMVERMPMTFDSPMHPNEDAAQGMIEDLDPGHSGRMTLRLRPGAYMLFCNMPGHFAAGQHIPFTVTES